MDFEEAVFNSTVDFFEECAFGRFFEEFVSEEMTSVFSEEIDFSEVQ